MKKFRLAVLAAVVCTAALLTSCIKEESYEVNMAQLDVRFDTRSSADSQSQGDGIKDVMLWAFKCTLDSDGNPTNVTEKATGYRYVANVNTYGSLENIHIELPVCGNGSETATQSYVVVAVINTEQFGETISFGNSTTYSELSKGTFNASNSLFWSYRPDDDKLVPEDMPVSSWATITLSNENKHPDRCLELTLPAYRAVAKTQLNMNKSSDLFGVIVTDVKIISTSAPNVGLILSKSSKKPDSGDAKRLCYPNQIDGPQWWGTPSSYVATEISLANAIDIDGDTGAVTTSFLPAGAFYDDDPAVYSPIGTAFLYENDGEIVNAGTEYDQQPTTGSGYYMQITYVFNRNKKTEDMLNSVSEEGQFTVSKDEGDEEVVRYVPLPKVVRNHDYRVNATVSVNVDGYLIVNYIVTDWSTATVEVPSFN